MSEKAKELQKEERTPAISSTGLNLAAAQNRARLLTPDEIAAQDKKVKGDFTGKGLIKKPEDPRRKTSKKPGTSIVYPAKDFEGNPKTITRDVPDGLYGVNREKNSSTGLDARTLVNSTSQGKWSEMHLDHRNKPKTQG